MNYNSELIKPLLSYDIINVNETEEAVELTVFKNKENLNLLFIKNTDYVNFCKFTYLQHKYGVLNELLDKLVVGTMIERNCNWVMLDNNLNFIQCFTDKQYYPVCKDIKQSYLRNREWWGTGKLITDGTVEITHFEGRSGYNFPVEVINHYEFKNVADDIYKYKILIVDLDMFV